MSDPPHVKRYVGTLPHARRTGEWWVFTGTYLLSATLTGALLIGMVAWLLRAITGDILCVCWCTAACLRAHVANIGCALSATPCNAGGECGREGSAVSFVPDASLMMRRSPSL